MGCRHSSRGFGALLLQAMLRMGRLHFLPHLMIHCTDELMIPHHAVGNILQIYRMSPFLEHPVIPATEP